MANVAWTLCLTIHASLPLMQGYREYDLKRLEVPFIAASYGLTLAVPSVWVILDAAKATQVLGNATVGVLALTGEAAC